MGFSARLKAAAHDVACSAAAARLSLLLCFFLLFRPRRLYPTDSGCPLSLNWAALPLVLRHDTTAGRAPIRAATGTESKGTVELDTILGESHA